MKKIVIALLAFGSFTACTNSSSGREQKQDTVLRDQNMQPDTSRASDTASYERMPGKTDTTRH